MRKVSATIRNLFRKEKAERELDEEVRSYVAMLSDEKARAGVRPNEARRNARMEMGGPEQLKEEIRSARAGAWIESLWQDVRFGLRTLRKNPGFAAIAILTLALGIGANTAVFSIVNAVVLRPLPYKDSSRLVDVQSSDAMFPGLSLGNSWIAIDRMRQQVSAFQMLTVYISRHMNLTQSGNPARLTVTQISKNFFELFGISPQLGQFPPLTDDASGPSRSVVLADATWRTRFGADPSVIGRTIRLDDKDYTIAAVAPRNFVYPDDADLWVPLSLTNEDRIAPVSFMYNVVARMKPGETPTHAQAELNPIAQAIGAEYPMIKEGYALRTARLIDRKVGYARAGYLMLLAAAGFVLLIACANLASMLLSRSWARQREMAVRAAMGASRSRIIRQALVESWLLALFGGAAGSAIAAAGVALFRAYAPDSTKRLNEIHPDFTMFAFALIVALVAGFIFGLVPALRISRGDPNLAIKEAGATGFAGSSSVHRTRLGSALVSAEVALAFVLLIGAVVTTSGLLKLVRTNTGMRTDHLLTFDLPQAPQPSRVAAESNRKFAASVNELLTHIGAVPGVMDVVASDHEILGGSIYVAAGFQLENDAETQSMASRTAEVRSISPGFFRLLGVPILRGREFSAQDVEGAEEVVMVNEAMAQQLWGTRDVVGKRVSFAQAKDNGRIWSNVVGVVTDTRDVTLGWMAKPEFYFPLLQRTSSDTIHMIVRTARNPGALTASVSNAVWTLNNRQPITNVRTMEQQVNALVGDDRMNAGLFTVFGAIGLTLSLVGVYGVITYSVTQRTREIAVRMALGAEPGRVLRMVIQQGIILAAIGVITGLAGAIAVEKYLASNFSTANAKNPLTYAAAAGSVLIVACLACYIPARRAMRVDPMVALRHE